MITTTPAWGRALLLAVALAAGALAPAQADAARKKNNYAELMNQAEAEVMAGRIEPALVQFNLAAQADPTRKEAWVRSAQLQFDAGNYGRAIVAAEEVLKRDPADLVADSVLTVGGLRIASQSLQRLRANGALETSDSARKEAEQLATSMRATLGNEILLSDDQRRANAAAADARRKAAQRAAAAKRAAANARRNAASAASGAATPAATPAPVSGGSGANPFGSMGGN